MRAGPMRWRCGIPMSADAGTWVLLRGLAREARHWGVFPAALSRVLGEAAVVTPDLPGNGRRFAQDSATSVAGQLEALRETLRAGNCRPPYSVVALSLGGMVALEWALRHPQEVSRLVLINSSVAGLSPFWQRLRWTRYPRLLSLPFRGLAGRERLILRLSSNRAAQAPSLLSDWIAWQRECPVSLANVLRQLLAAARFRMPRHWPQVPGLVLASRADRLVDGSCSEALAEAARWPLIWHEQAGHDLALDDPDWLANRIGVWVRHTPGCALAEADAAGISPVLPPAELEPD